MTASETSPEAAGEPPVTTGFWALTLGSIGVVFGDIGTSPLYASRATVLATEGGLPNHVAVMGSLSMFFWALILVVVLQGKTTVKLDTTTFKIPKPEKIND